MSVITRKPLGNQDAIERRYDNRASRVARAFVEPVDGVTWVRPALLAVSGLAAFLMATPYGTGDPKARPSVGSDAGRGGFGGPGGVAVGSIPAGGIASGGITPGGIAPGVGPGETLSWTAAASPAAAVRAATSAASLSPSSTT